MCAYFWNATRTNLWLQFNCIISFKAQLCARQHPADGKVRWEEFGVRNIHQQVVIGKVYRRATVLHVFTLHTAHTTTHCAQKLLEAHNTDFNSTICLATLVVRAVDDVKWLWKPDRKNSGRIDQQLKFENITSSQSGSNISDQINVEAGLSWLTWLASVIFYLHTV